MRISKLFGGGLAKLAMAATLAFGLAGTASATLIDNFSDNQAVLTTTGGTVSSEVCGGSMLGGCRDITIVAAVAAGGTNPTSSASVAGGFLNIANDSGIASTVTVGWDGPGIPGTGLAPAANFTSTLGILVQVFFTDLGMSVTMELGDGTNTASRTLVIPSTELPAPTGPVNYLFSLSDFVSVPGAIDLANLTSIRMIVSGNNAYDANLSFVDTTPVPEPSTMLLSAAALLALGFFRRRRA